jgi:hypothetical protein
MSTRVTVQGVVSQGKGAFGTFYTYTFPAVPQGSSWTGNILASIVPGTSLSPSDQNVYLISLQYAAFVNGTPLTLWNGAGQLTNLTLGQGDVLTIVMQSTELSFEQNLVQLQYVALSSTASDPTLPWVAPVVVSTGLSATPAQSLSAYNQAHVSGSGVASSNIITEYPVTVEGLFLSVTANATSANSMTGLVMVWDSSSGYLLANADIYATSQTTAYGVYIPIDDYVSSGPIAIEVSSGNASNAFFLCSATVYYTSISGQ